MAHFTITESLTFGWHKTRAHSGLVFKVLLTFFVIEVASAVVKATLHGTLLGGLAGLAIFVLELFLGTGATLIALKLAHNEHAHYQDLLPPWRLVLRFTLAGFLIGLIMLIPFALAFLFAALAGFDAVVTSAAFIAAIVAALYIAIRLGFARFAVLDGARIVESLRRSAKLTRHVMVRLLGFVVTAILLNILGTILLVIGLLVSIPVTIIAAAHIYVKLKNHA